MMVPKNPSRTRKLDQHCHISTNGHKSLSWLCAPWDPTDQFAVIGLHKCHSIPQRGSAAHDATGLLSISRNVQKKNNLLLTMSFSRKFRTPFCKRLHTKLQTSREVVFLHFKRFLADANNEFSLRLYYTSCQYSSAMHTWTLPTTGWLHATDRSLLHVKAYFNWLQSSPHRSSSSIKVFRSSKAFSRKMPFGSLPSRSMTPPSTSSDANYTSIVQHLLVASFLLSSLPTPQFQLWWNKSWAQQSSKWPHDGIADRRLLGLLRHKHPSRASWSK